MGGEIERPPGLIPVPLGKGCVLLLTEQEYTRALHRGKAWRRQEALAKRADQSKATTREPRACA